MILIGSGIVGLGFLVWYEIEHRWITPPERSSAKAALILIDALQDSSSLSDEEFESRKQQVDAKVKLAGVSTTTQMDRQIYLRLELCLGGLELEHDGAAINRSIAHGQLSVDQKVKAAGMLNRDNGNAMKIYRIAFHELHNALD